MSEARQPVAIQVDGTWHRAEIRPRLLLSDFLRDIAGARGVHVGCGQGVCGACTVLADGVPARACLMFALQADGAELLTVASLPEIEQRAAQDGLTPLQQAFQRHHALQCGYCSPGLLVATAAFLAARDTAPDDRDILDHLNGHLCRCTGYANIVAAIRDAGRARLDPA